MLDCRASRGTLLIPLIAIIEVLYGVIGLVRCGGNLVEDGGGQLAAYCWRALPLLLGAVVGGVLLARRRPLGFRLSGALQGAQAIQLSTGSILYRVALGPELTVGTDGLAFFASVGASPHFWMGATVGTGPRFLAVNVVAVLMAWYLLAHRRGAG